MYSVAHLGSKRLQRQTQNNMEDALILFEEAISRRQTKRVVKYGCEFLKEASIVPLHADGNQRLLKDVLLVIEQLVMLGWDNVRKWNP